MARTAIVTGASRGICRAVAKRPAADRLWLRGVVNALPGLVWTALPDGHIDFLNRRWCEYTGLGVEQARGQGWRTIVDPEDLPELVARWRSMVVSGEPGDMEARLRRFDGEYRWFLISANPMRDNAGQIVKWYGVNTDIDDRKRAEEKLRPSQAFLAEGQKLSRVGNLSWLVETDEIRWSEQLYRIFEFELGIPITLDLIGSRVHPEDLPLMSDMVEKAHRGVSDFACEHRLLMPDHSVKYLHLTAHGGRDNQGRQGTSVRFRM